MPKHIEQSTESMLRKIIFNKKKRTYYTIEAGVIKEDRTTTIIL